VRILQAALRSPRSDPVPINLHRSVTETPGMIEGQRGLGACREEEQVRLEEEVQRHRPFGDSVDLSSFYATLTQHT
jgi:hypothetical protein